MFGLLNVAKPTGPTSHDVVARVRRALPRRTRVGHTGTLDPFAAGVLVLCIGPATRLAEYVGGQPKQYLAEVTFGAISTTDDSQGELTPTAAPPPREAALRDALGRFVGEIQQVPPAYSAIKVQGQRAYKLARQEQEVTLAARTVRIDAVELLGYEAGRARLRIDCGGGTYIRALARDLGLALGCGGYCSALTRSAVGPFTLDDALPADAVSPETIAEHLLPARLAVADWPAVTLDDPAIADIRMGRAVEAPEPAPPPGPVVLLDGAGTLVALARRSPYTNRLEPQKVFPLDQP